MVDIDRQCIVIHKAFIVSQPFHDALPGYSLPRMFKEKLQNPEFIFRQLPPPVLIRQGHVRQIQNCTAALHLIAPFYQMPPNCLCYDIVILNNQDSVYRTSCMFLLPILITDLCARICIIAQRNPLSALFVRLNPLIQRQRHIVGKHAEAVDHLTRNADLLL